MNRRKWILAIPIAIAAFLKWLAGESSAGPVVTTGSFNGDVPDMDSSDNITIRDVIGSKADTHDGDSLYARAHIIDEHAHKAAGVFPTLANGEVIVGAANAWALGSFKEIVPANGISSNFDIHYITVEAVSVSDVYEIILYAGTTEIGRVRIAFIDVANSSTLPSIPFQCGIQPANTQIQAKSANKTGASAGQITVSLHYHIY